MDRYAVIGNPIAHSKSPQIHAEFARQTGQRLSYDAILAPLGGFRESVSDFVELGGKGLNVTVPFKLEAFELAGSLTQRAKSARAVNTLLFDQDRIHGDNTDGVGLIQDLTCNLKARLEAKRILLMGAGGAARGVIVPLLKERPALLAIANRTLAKAQALQSEFAALVATEEGVPSGIALWATGYPALEGLEFDVVINATRASLDHDLPRLPEGIFSAGGLAYDMMYGRGLTPFLSFAKQRGAEGLADGLGMLVEQAAESFYLWRRVRPDTGQVLRLLRQEVP